VTTERDIEKFGKNVLGVDSPVLVAFVAGPEIEI
jgi:hypothetical protein